MHLAKEDDAEYVNLVCSVVLTERMSLLGKSDNAILCYNKLK